MKQENELLCDVKILLRQINLLEHLQNRDVILKLCKKYKIDPYTGD